MTTNRIVGILQNAWSPFYAGEIWPRELWLAALHRCRSGQRLKNLTAICGDIYFDNTTPMVAATANGKCKPDKSHIISILTAQSPTHVITFGRQAYEAVRPLWSGHLLSVPHPACRVVTNELYRWAGLLLSNGFKGRAELKQQQHGYVTIKKLL